MTTKSIYTVTNVKLVLEEVWNRGFIAQVPEADLIECICECIDIAHPTAVKQFLKSIALTRRARPGPGGIWLIRDADPVAAEQESDALAKAQDNEIQAYNELPENIKSPEQEERDRQAAIDFVKDLENSMERGEITA